MSIIRQDKAGYGADNKTGIGVSFLFLILFCFVLFCVFFFDTCPHFERLLHQMNVWNRPESWLLLDIV